MEEHPIYNLEVMTVGRWIHSGSFNRKATIPCDEDGVSEMRSQWTINMSNQA